MKVVAFNGSPHVNGNTHQAIEFTAEVLRQEGIEVSIVHVGNKVIRGCTACNQCVKNRNERCVIDDEVNQWIQLMKEADGIILASPVHFSGVAGTMKSFLDRAFYTTGMNKSMLRHKVGAAIVAVRRSGGMPTFEQLNNFLNYSEMLMPTSNYWNVIHGTKPGDVQQDQEGIQLLQVLGENMAYMLKMREATTVEPSPLRRKTFTNFIR